jgi:hypothetical protein
MAISLPFDRTSPAISDVARDPSEATRDALEDARRLARRRNRPLDGQRTIPWEAGDHGGPEAVILDDAAPLPRSEGCQHAIAVGNARGELPERRAELLAGRKLVEEPHQLRHRLRRDVVEVRGRASPGKRAAGRLGVVPLDHPVRRGVGSLARLLVDGSLGQEGRLFMGPQPHHGGIEHDQDPGRDGHFPQPDGSIRRLSAFLLPQRDHALPTRWAAHWPFWHAQPPPPQSNVPPRHSMVHITPLQAGA